MAPFMYHRPTTSSPPPTQSRPCRNLSTYVFLGPTLSVREARLYVNATFLPSVRAGSLERVLSQRPSVVAVIDGCWDALPGAREIATALASGVRLYGAGGAGAELAVRYHALGIKGIGTAYEWHVRGESECD